MKTADLLGKPKTKSVNVRITPDERMAIQCAADREGRTVSDYIRRIAVPVATGQARVFFDERAA